MSFSATDWRNRLSEWSGSLQGDRSWSALGRSTRIGEYFNYFYKNGSNQLRYVYRGFSYPNQSPYAEKNVEPYYAYAYQTIYVYAYSYDNLCGYTQVFAAYSYNSPFNFYVGQGNYTGLAEYISTNIVTAYSTNPSYYSMTTFGAYAAVSSWSPSTFYNYSPWGAGPYSAGSNISIGAGNGPYSGYPYQYIHN